MCPAAPAAAATAVQPHEICLRLTKGSPLGSIKVDDWIEVMVYDIFDPSSFFVRIIGGDGHFRDANTKFRKMEAEMK